MCEGVIKLPKYLYTHLIPENIAPHGAMKIGVYDVNDNLVHQFSTGRLTPPIGEPLYSFGLISDTHLMQYSGVSATLKFENAMNWFEGKADFVCHCGDVTNHGFYANTDTGEVDLKQFEEFDNIRKLHPNLPVYCTFGNHDSYHEPNSIYGRSLTNDLDLLETYTGLVAEDEYGRGILHYRVDYEGDVFLFVGNDFGGSPMSTESYEWLIGELNNLNGKRCFIFVHGYFSDDSGDPKKAYGSSLLDDKRISGLKPLLAQTPNTMLFHGHSHFRFDQQEIDKTAVYTNKNGFHSVHVPSLAAPAYIGSDGKRVQSATESYGYLVDVYADCIFLRGRNFGKVSGSTMVEPSWDAIGTYKIDIAQQSEE